MEIKLELPTEQHIQALLLELSVEDRNEAYALGADPQWAIRHSLDNSLEAVAISTPEGLGCITGIAHFDGLVPQTYPWMLGTPLVLAYPKTAWKLSKTILNRWIDAYPYMHNFVDARHSRAIRWLRRLGADISEAAPAGPYNRPFHKFSFGSDPCASQR